MGVIDNWRNMHQIHSLPFLCNLPLFSHVLYDIWKNRFRLKGIKNTGPVFSAGRYFNRKNTLWNQKLFFNIIYLTNYVTKHIKNRPSINFKMSFMLRCNFYVVYYSRRISFLFHKIFFFTVCKNDTKIIYDFFRKRKEIR